MTNGKPNVGDMVIIPHSTLRDGHVLARVAKVGKVMWEVAAWGREGWRDPVKRRVDSYAVLPPTTDPASIAAKLRNLREELWAAERRLKEQYRADVDALSAGK